MTSLQVLQVIARTTLTVRAGARSAHLARALLYVPSMNTSPRALVHQLVASRLNLDAASIDDADHFDDLGLSPLDLVLIVLRLERLDRGDGEFPVFALEHATTVGDLVDVVELWLQADTVRSPEAHGLGI